MSIPPGPDPDDESSQPGHPEDPDAVTEAVHRGEDPETEIFEAQGGAESALPTVDPDERRFTAPSGMDDGSTQIIDRNPDPETEVFTAVGAPPNPEDSGKIATPQAIPPRPGGPKPPRQRSWGWVIAVVLVIAALVAIAVLATVLLTRGTSIGTSQEDRVRETIQSYDTAIEKGDLATLRSITCGQTADEYNKVDDRKWAETHQRIIDAGQNPVIASIDQVIINDGHAEANVTTFVESDPSTRSTRSLDLQFRDDQWKICQDAGN